MVVHFLSPNYQVIYRHDASAQFVAHTSVRREHARRRQKGQRHDEKLLAVKRSPTSYLTQKATAWSAHLRAILRTGDVLRVPASLGGRVCTTGLQERLRQGLQQRQQHGQLALADAVDDGELVSEVMAVSQQPEEGDGLFFRIVHKSPANLKVMRTRAAGGASKLDAASMIVTVHASLGAGIALPTCIDSRPSGQAMVLNDLRPVFPELRDVGVTCWGATQSLVYKLPGAPDLGGQGSASTCLSRLMHCDREQGLVVAPSEDAMLRVLAALRAQGYAEEDSRQRWRLTTAALRHLRIGFAYEEKQKICEPRAGDLDMDKLTSYELLCALEGDGWVWRKAPRGAGKAGKARLSFAITDEGVVMTDRVLHGKLERLYLMVCLMAQREPKRLMDLGITEVFHRRKVWCAAGCSAIGYVANMLSRSLAGLVNGVRHQKSNL